MGKKRDNLVYKKLSTTFFTLFLIMFFLGFFFGWKFSDTSLSDSQIALQNAELDLRSIYERAEFASIFEGGSCDSSLLDYMSRKLYETGVELEDLENQGSIGSNYYDFLKQKHNLNQVFFYSEYKKFVERCEMEPRIILFFFNSAEPQESRKQGRELDVLVDEHDFNIIPMDYNYTSDLDYFYNFYEVNDLPLLVINYNHSFEGFTSTEEIVKILELK